MRSAVIPRCGRFSAPGTCARAYAPGPRTSSSTKSGAPSSIAPCTSSQSVSSDRRRAKCSAATSDGAVGVAVTRLGIARNSSSAPAMLAPLPARWKAARSPTSVNIVPNRHAPAPPSNPLVVALAAAYPDIRVEPDVLYVDEGQVLTSAGSAAGLDVCLHLVRRDFGPEVANRLARRLVIPPHREGGQAQYIERPVPPAREGARLSPLLDRMRARLDEPHPIARLAAEAGMSARTFLRRFKAATGLTPGDWLLAERLARARELLEGTRRPLDHIAAACGFGSPATLRHHFRTRLGTSPAAYRARFGRASATSRQPGDAVVPAKAGTHRSERADLCRQARCTRAPAHA